MNFQERKGPPTTKEPTVLYLSLPASAFNLPPPTFPISSARPLKSLSKGHSSPCLNLTSYPETSIHSACSNSTPEPFPSPNEPGCNHHYMSAMEPT